MTKFTSALLLSASLLSLPAMAMDPMKAEAGPADDPRTAAINKVCASWTPEGRAAAQRDLNCFRFFWNDPDIGITSLQPQQFRLMRALFLCAAEKPEDVAFAHLLGYRLKGAMIAPHNTTFEGLTYKLTIHEGLDLPWDLSQVRLPLDPIMEAIRQAGGVIKKLTLPRGASLADVVTLARQCPLVEAISPKEGATNKDLAAATTLWQEIKETHTLLQAEREILAATIEALKFIDTEADAPPVDEENLVATAALKSMDDQLAAEDRDNERILHFLRQYVSGVEVQLDSASFDVMISTLSALATNFSAGLNLSDAQCQLLIAVLKNNSATSLRIYFSRSFGLHNMRPIGLFLEHLPDFPQLTILNINNNNIGSAGARALAAALPSVPQLQSLNLTYNNIGDEGARALIGALVGSAVTSLNLSHNHIGDAGKEALRVMITVINAKREVNGLSPIDVRFW